VNRQWIQLGIVGKAHGLGGAFFISHREDPLPPSLKSLRIGKDPALSSAFSVKFCRKQTGRPVLQCQEISSRDAAEALIGLPLWGLRSDLGLDEETEYLWADLVGKSVVDSAGKTVGILVQVGNFGASDIVQIRRDSGGILDVPFVKAYFDFGFSAADETLQMTVSLETFDGTWSDD
jgi:16S rRNA processing protein RimM